MYVHIHYIKVTKIAHHMTLYVETHFLHAFLVRLNVCPTVLLAMLHYAASDKQWFELF